MADPQQKSCIYTIPAGVSFVDALARGILAQAGNDPLTLARMQILLPTRRAARSLRDAFLKLSEGRPLLLPRMSPIGDVDEEELSLNLSGAEDELDLPPSITPMRRQLLLATLIGSIEERSRGIEQDLALAAALGRLMDQIHTEDLDLADLPKAVDREDFAKHWQISLDFLSILSHHWPLILAEQGVIDAAERRNKLLKKLAQHWEENPPHHTVIAAGSTGSIPATGRLLKTIAGLPRGCIVLPGLDQVMDEESWEKLDDTHPQKTLKNLLEAMKVDREKVTIWPSCAEDAQDRKIMQHFCSEIMRPAETAQEWQSVAQRLALHKDDIAIQRYDCANPQEEALVIALCMRNVLESPTKTAALVTPDRKLARRVAMACRRWGIAIDDSGGQPLPKTRAGTYLRLCMEAICAELKPVALLDFCKHSLCRPQGQNTWRESVRKLDLTLLRGPAFEGGIAAYRKKLAILKDGGKDIADLQRSIDFIERAFGPLLTLSEQNIPLPFTTWCDAHLQVAENFCDRAILWSHQDGESLSAFLSDLKEESGLLPSVDAKTYLGILKQAMSGVAVRPAFGLHPRLRILGQLESRLAPADVMILSGLNEGTWPPDAGVDPWMSRPMRKRFGLPPLERSIGLSAHDFAQAMCAREVVLTRALHVDGTPTVPSRWLQRMDTVLQAYGLDPASVLQGPVLAQARTMDHTDLYAPVERPAPRPPVDVRPRQLSVTKIDTWINDPYSIYARHILKLKPLDPLEQSLDAAMRGTLLHSVLDRFVAACPDIIPSGAHETFMRIAREELNALSLDDDVKSFWEPRLAKMAGWVVDTETSWRSVMKPANSEAEGALVFAASYAPFRLTARADRIDRTLDGTGAALIDYKSGGAYSAKGMINGKYPQLPLEALILEAGGFSGTDALAVENLSYWVIHGGKDGGKITKLDKPADLAAAKENARQGLMDLIEAFDSPETPYYSLPRPERAPRFNDYEHLARVREWTALDESEDAA